MSIENFNEIMLCEIRKLNKIKNKASSKLTKMEFKIKLIILIINPLMVIGEL